MITPHSSCYDAFYFSPNYIQQTSMITSENVVSGKRNQENADINFQKNPQKKIKLNGPNNIGQRMQAYNVLGIENQDLLSNANTTKKKSGNEKADEFKNKSISPDAARKIFHDKNREHLTEKYNLLDQIEKLNDENISFFLKENLENILNLSYYGGRNTNKAIYDMITGWTEDHQILVAKCLLGIPSLSMISFLDYLHMYSKPITNNDIFYLKNALSGEATGKKKLMDHVGTLNKAARNKHAARTYGYQKESQPKLVEYNTHCNFQVNAAINTTLKTSSFYKNNSSLVPIFDNFAYEANNVRSIANRMSYPQGLKLKESKHPIQTHNEYRPEINSLYFEPMEPELHSMSNEQLSLQYYEKKSQSGFQKNPPYRHPY